MHFFIYINMYSIPRTQLFCDFTQNQIPRVFPRAALCTGVKGHIYEKKPAKVDVEEGKMYAWCACGRSKKQVCDVNLKSIPSQICRILSSFTSSYTFNDLHI